MGAASGEARQAKALPADSMRRISLSAGWPSGSTVMVSNPARPPLTSGSSPERGHLPDDKREIGFLHIAAGE